MMIARANPHPLADGLTGALLTVCSW
jgi:hypothetical protein